MAGRDITPPSPDAARLATEAALAESQACLARSKRNTRAFGPYGPRDLMAGDPASPGGAKVTCDELADDVLAKIGSGGGPSLRVREVDGSPDIDPTSIITVPNDSLTPGGPEEAILSLSGFALREAVLVFSGATIPVPANTAINIQTGAYTGTGSPATVNGDTNVTLPASAALFNDDGRIEILLNGVELEKGGTGPCAVEWVSTTQIRLPGNRIFQGNKLTIKAPPP